VGRVFVLDAAKTDAGDGERARREVDAPRTSHHQIEKAHHVGFGDEIRIKSDTILRRRDARAPFPLSIHPPSIIHRVA